MFVGGVNMQEAQIYNKKHLQKEPPNKGLSQHFRKQSM